MDACKQYYAHWKKRLFLSGFLFLVAIQIVICDNTPEPITDLLKRTLQQIDEYKDVNPEQALAIADEFIKSVEDEELSNGAGLIFIEIGKIYENDAKYLTALKYYQKAQQIFKRTKSKSNQAEATYRLAKINKKIGLYENALAYSLNALEHCQASSDTSGLARVFNILGSIYKYQDNPNKAIEYYQRFQDIAEARNDLRDVATALNNIGVVYEEIGKTQLAKSFYKQSININEKIGKSYKSGTYYGNIGGVYLKEGDFQKAKECFLKSYNFKKQEFDTKGMALALGDLGDYYLAVDSINEAILHYDKAIGLLDESGARQYLKSLYFGIHKAYLKKYDYHNAYEFYKKYHVLTDKLTNNEVIKKLSFWEWEQKLAQQNEIEQLEKEQARMFVILILVVSGLLILFVFTLYQRQKSRYNQALLKSENEKLNKEKIENELDIKNKELTIYSLQVAKSGELTDIIVQKLEQTKYNLKKENRVVIQSIINDLKQEQKQDQWKEFEICFSKVHEQFYTNLINEYPDLTIKELRLCALLRMNMSTKDIASMVGQMPHSINIARTRLRKKLNLTGKNVDLNHFISEY